MVPNYANRSKLIRLSSDATARSDHPGWPDIGGAMMCALTHICPARLVLLRAAGRSIVKLSGPGRLSP